MDLGKPQTIIKVGGSYAITIPAKYFEYLHWRKHDFVRVELTARNTLEIHHLKVEKESTIEQ